jgi:hypothetical protein
MGKIINSAIKINNIMFINLIIKEMCLSNDNVTVVVYSDSSLENRYAETPIMYQTIQTIGSFENDVFKTMH